MLVESLRFTLLICFIVLVYPTVFACTCTDYNVPTCKLFGDADAVFVGKIDSIVPAKGGKDPQVSLNGVGSISSRETNLVLVQFSVERAIKGVNSNVVTALTYGGTSCDLGVKVGQRWLIFASKSGINGPLGFGACGGSNELTYSDAKIKELEALLDPNGPFTVQGRIRLDLYNPIRGANVFLSGQGAHLESQTDEQGFYFFRVPKPGIYHVKLTVPFSAGPIFFTPIPPPNYKREKLSETESIIKYDTKVTPGSCSYQPFDLFKLDLKANAVISGIFKNSDRKNYRKYFPKICELKQTEAETLQNCETLFELKPDGKFEFGGLREGLYTIVIGNSWPSGQQPFYRHYYPGVRDFSKAKGIEIKQGERKKGIRFNLPSILPTKRVIGQIFTSDGNPAALRNGDGRFFYLSPYFLKKEKVPELFVYHSYRKEWDDSNKTHEVEMVNVLPDGRFELELFDGFTYILKVESGQRFNNYDCGFGKINVNSNLTVPVRIVLDQKRPCDVMNFAPILISK